MGSSHRGGETHVMSRSLLKEAAWLPKMWSLFQNHAPQDISKIKEFQKCGTDAFILPAGSAHQEPLWIEFKFDFRQTPNVALEWVSRCCNFKNTVTPGWMITSQAGWIAYLFVHTGEMLFLRLDVLRTWLWCNYDKNKSTSAANTAYFSLCSLVPAQTLIESLPEDSCMLLDIKPLFPGIQFSTEVPPRFACVDRSKLITVDEMMARADTAYRKSHPHPVDLEQTPPLLAHLFERNLMKKLHTKPDPLKKREVILHEVPAFSWQAPDSLPAVAV